MPYRDDIAAFAVVGHPNKGKSSIVAALTQRDDITVSPMPGTTRAHRTYALEIDGKRLFELIDTPGFQRPREALERIRAYQNEGLRPVEALRRFVADERDNPRFADEIELLTPVVEEGAGIVYVVDGSKPYGAEFDAEMEILRLSARPSMAVINRIGKGDYVESWREALTLHFNIVRTYNPMTARLQEHVRLLESMGHADERWLTRMQEAARILEAQYARRVRQSARLIARTLVEMAQLRVRMPIDGTKADKEEKERLHTRYRKAFVALEEKAETVLRRIWNHTRLSEAERHAVDATRIELFSRESASIFGLSKAELLAAGAISGAVSGAGVDLLFLGHTLFVGGALGALMGAAGAYMAFDKLAQLRILGMQAGRYEIEAGPLKDINVAYMVAGRLLHYAYVLALLSHAYRDEVAFAPDASFRARWLDNAAQKEIAARIADAVKGKEAQAATEALEALFDDRLRRLLNEDGVSLPAQGA